MAAWVLIPVVIFLVGSLTGCSAPKKSDEEENSEVEKGDKEEIKGYVKDNNEIEPTQCVSNARVICTNASSDSEPVSIKKENSKIYVEDFGQLNKTDIELESQFKECTNPEANKKCSLIPEYILDKEWKAAEEGSDEGEGLETLTKENAYMICEKYSGLIYFYDAGQVVKANKDELLKEGEKKAFENDLREKGFPDGYIGYLMALHEKYPKWEFEAVITNIDYQEFLEYQINNNTKCADSSAYPIYCTNERFTGEQDPKYYIANSDAIRFFSHPYSMLQTSSEWSYENAIQFLNGEQELPQEFVDKVVPSMLRNEDEEIVKLIQNSNSCVNPVFMASIYVAESGPKGVEYNGRKVYNFFNIGAYTGAEASKKYAYENGWFTPEDCIKGSEEELQKFIDRGQNTLYSLDWDYQTFKDKGIVEKQYATLVNDAEDKAIIMQKRGDETFDLNQELTFSIPVYENIPTYNDEEYVAFPDPNKIK